MISPCSCRSCQESRRQEGPQEGRQGCQEGRQGPRQEGRQEGRPQEGRQEGSRQEGRRQGPRKEVITLSVLIGLTDASHFRHKFENYNPASHLLLSHFLSSFLLSLLTYLIQWLLSFSINQLLYVVGVTLMRGVAYLGGVGHTTVTIWELRQGQHLSYKSLFLNVHSDLLESCDKVVDHIRSLVFLTSY